MAFAYATELSDNTLAASARLIGAATLALIKDMAARSGSASMVSAWSSSSSPICFIFSAYLLEGCVALDPLWDVVRLNGVGISRCVVAQDVESERRVNWGRNVGVDQ